MKKKLVYSFFIINIGIILFFWYRATGQFIFDGVDDALQVLGRVFGLLAVFSILTQFLLMGRSIWIEKVFGLDKVAQIHKLNGYASISLILSHIIFLSIGHAMSASVSPWSQFIEFITNFDDVLEAFIGTLIIFTVVFLSIYIVRRKLKYEFWYAVHLLTYLAVILTWGHQLENGEDFVNNPAFVYYWYSLYIFVFGNVLLFRFIRPWFNTLKHGFYISDIIKENDEVISLYISGKNIENFKIKSGQFMILRFLDKNFWWEAHPFSLSYGSENRPLRITPKQLGDFTKKLSLLKKGTKVYIDGPYGVFTEEQSTEQKVLLIAGGIGITPIRSLLESMLLHKKDIIVLYTNKTQDEIVFKNELDLLNKKYPFSLHYILTQEKSEGFISGRLDKEKLQSLVKDVEEREIYICGPIPMTEVTREMMAELGVHKDKIHFEKFAL
jgi:predicted ferric reductase